MCSITHNIKHPIHKSKRDGYFSPVVPLLLLLLWLLRLLLCLVVLLLLWVVVLLLWLASLVAGQLVRRDDLTQIVVQIAQVLHARLALVDAGEECLHAVFEVEGADAGELLLTVVRLDLLLHLLLLYGVCALPSSQRTRHLNRLQHLIHFFLI